MMLSMLMAFRITIAAFPEGGTIPAEYTCQGADTSPAIGWSDTPAPARSFALIVDDPDAPGGVFNHWLLANIPGSARSLPKGSRIGDSATNDFGDTGYRGPCPPQGHGPHRYFFRLYALDVPKLDLSKTMKRAGLDRIMKSHILATAEYLGKFERK